MLNQLIKETSFDSQAASDYEDQQALLNEIAEEEAQEPVDMFSMEAMYEGNTNWTHELLEEEEEEVDMFSMEAMYLGNTNWKMEA